MADDPSQPPEIVVPEIVSADEAAADRPHLWHLFLWTGCCAVVLGLARAGRMSDHAGVGTAVMLTLLGGLGGTALMELVLAIQYWRQGRRLEPGHWLAASEGAFVIGFMLCFLIPGARFFEEKETITPFYVFLLVKGPSALVLAIAMRDRRMVSRWRVALGMRFWNDVLMIVGSIGISMMEIANQLAMLCLMAVIVLFILDRLMWLPVMIAASQDPTDRRRYGWLHRLGVWVTILLGVATSLCFCLIPAIG